MKTITSEIPVIYLHPGEICYSNESIYISTILGSCLAITMYSPGHKFSSVSHCLLPNCNEFGADCNNCDNAYKYVDCTVMKMLEKFEGQNIKRQDIEIKIFGGANLIAHNNAPGFDTVGSKNIKTALDIISQNNLRIVTSDVGGVNGRKILFHTDSGEVYLNRLKK